MIISLLDDSLKIQIFFDKKDCEFGDNICVTITEECPDDEKVFRADETNLYLTHQQARMIASAMIHAANESSAYCASDESEESPGI